MADCNVIRWKDSDFNHLPKILRKEWVIEGNEQKTHLGRISPLSESIRANYSHEKVKIEILISVLIASTYGLLPLFFLPAVNTVFSLFNLWSLRD